MLTFQRHYKVQLCAHPCSFRIRFEFRCNCINSHVSHQSSHIDIVQICQDMSSVKCPCARCKNIEDKKVWVQLYDLVCFGKATSITCRHWLVLSLLMRFIDSWDYDEVRSCSPLTMYKIFIHCSIQYRKESKYFWNASASLCQKLVKVFF